jgi:hypothetical protein
MRRFDPYIPRQEVYMTLDISCWAGNPPTMPCDISFDTPPDLEWGILISGFVLGLALIYWWRPRG